MTPEVPALYDTIGRGYDATRRADPKLGALLKERLRLEPNLAVLDIGCGTANYTSFLAPHARFTGLDISARMLAAARAKTDQVNFVRGDAVRLPFPDASFDRALTTLAMHHFHDMDRALGEARRVLRGGPYVLFAFFREQMETYWLRHYFPLGLADDPKVSGQMRPRIESALRAARFSHIDIEPWFLPDGFTDQFFYAGKRNPAFYLDQEKRRGISYFTDPQSPDEIARGLATLARDIESGKVWELIAQDDDPLGDYALITAWP